MASPSAEIVTVWAAAVPDKPTRKKIRAATVALSARVVLYLEEEGLRGATVVKKRVPSGRRIIQILIGEEGKAQTGQHTPELNMSIKNQKNNRDLKTVTRFAPFSHRVKARTLH